MSNARSRRNAPPRAAPRQHIPGIAAIFMNPPHPSATKIRSLAAIFHSKYARRPGVMLPSARLFN